MHCMIVFILMILNSGKVLKVFMAIFLGGWGGGGSGKYLC